MESFLIIAVRIPNKYVVEYGRVLVAQHLDTQHNYCNNEVRLSAVFPIKKNYGKKSLVFLNRAMPLPSFTQFLHIREFWN